MKKTQSKPQPLGVGSSALVRLSFALGHDYRELCLTAKETFNRVLHLFVGRESGLVVGWKYRNLERLFSCNDLQKQLGCDLLVERC
jgi:hypothetical protein